MSTYGKCGSYVKLVTVTNEFQNSYESSDESEQIMVHYAGELQFFPPASATHHYDICGTLFEFLPPISKILDYWNISHLASL